MDRSMSDDAISTWSMRLNTALLLRLREHNANHLPVLDLREDLFEDSLIGLDAPEGIHVAVGQRRGARACWSGPEEDAEGRPHRPVAQLPHGHVLPGVRRLVDAYGDGEVDL